MRRAKTEKQRQHVKAADDGHGPHHRPTRLHRGTYREEAHQDVRQPCGAEHQGHAEADLIDRRLEIQPRLQKALPQLRRAHRLGRIPQQTRHACLHLRVRHHIGQKPRQGKTIRRPHQHDDHDRSGHQQHRLDDLHPRRRHHAAKQHIGEHQDTHPNDRGLVIDADQGLHQHPAADHLRRQIKRRHGDRRERSDNARFLRIVPIRQDVRERVAADIAARLGDQQQHRDVGDQPADRIHEPIIAVQRNEPCNAQKGGGR